MTAPCKDCSDRTLGCHSVCDKYKSWKDYIENIKKAMNADAEVDGFLRMQTERRKAKHRRKRNQHGTN